MVGNCLRRCFSGWPWISSMAGLTRGLAAKQQWIRCGRFLVIPHGEWRFALMMPVSVQKREAACTNSWHSLALASVKTSAASRHSGMPSVSFEAWSLNTAAEPECNSRLFSVGLQTTVSSDFRSLWRCSAQNTCLIMIYAISSCRQSFNFYMK